MVPASVLQLVREWCPPRVQSFLRRHRRRFDGPFETWADAEAAAGEGYRGSEILQTVLQAARAVRDGQAAFERDGVTFREPNHVWPVVASLLRAAAKNGGRLRVIDFGGSLGSTFTQHRQLFDGLSDLRWSVVEQAQFVQCGRDEFADEQLRFYENLNDCASSGPHEVALLSSVLQYLPNPHDIVTRLYKLGIEHVIVARTAVDYSATTDRFYVQRVDPQIYRASYPIRVFTAESLESCCFPFTRVSGFLSPVDRQEPFAQVGLLLQASTKPNS